MPDLRRIVRGSIRGLLMLTLLLPLAVAQARPGQQEGPVSASAGPPEDAIDLRILVDISGSMRVNDPENMRRPAVRLLGRLLPDNSGAGLWLFGQQVNMLVPHGPVDDAWRQQMLEASGQISSVALRTNLGAALEKASDAWTGRNYPGPVHLILLTDGMADISADPAVNDRERTRIATELAPALARAGVIIHAIALSAEADLDLMGLLADLTGGSAHIAPTADALSRVFADTLGQVSAQDEVPIRDNRFLIDDGVEEFTALVFSGLDSTADHLSLISPAGRTYSSSSAGTSVVWASEADYDLITITDPAPGQWRIEGRLGQGSRVTVVSDLRLVVAPMPPRFRLGESVEVLANFEASDSPVTQADFLQLLRVSLTLTTADGRSGTRVLSPDRPPEDGVYRDTIARLQEPGTYLLELEADGQTFSRKYRQTLTLIDPASDQPVMAELVNLPPPEEAGPLPPEEPAAPASGPVDVPLTEQPPEQPVEDSTEPGRSITDQLRAWQGWLAGGLVLVLMVLAGGWLIAKRKRSASEPDTKTAASTPEPDDDLPPGPPVEPSSDEEDALAAIPVVHATAEEPHEDEQEIETESPEPDPEDDEALLEAFMGSAGADSLSLPDEDDDEFGLEDFDLADIDDLGESHQKEEPPATGSGQFTEKDSRQKPPGTD